MATPPVERVRAICLSLPESSERLSHGAPTFFVGKRVFATFADNHHGDGRVAIWLPAAPGEQQRLIDRWPTRFFRPPYVGCRGWVGIVLGEVGDAELEVQIRSAWELARARPGGGPPRKRAAVRPPARPSSPRSRRAAPKGR